MVVLLVNTPVGGGALTWTGFAHFDHAPALAKLLAHAILSPRAPLTAAAPSATTTQCRKKPCDAQHLWAHLEVSLICSACWFGGCCCRKVTTAHSPSAEVWGEHLLQEREREEKPAERKKQCEEEGCAQSWGRRWSEATHFAWLLQLSFWSWASRHEKQQHLGISPPPPLTRLPRQYKPLTQLEKKPLQLRSPHAQVPTPACPRPCSTSQAAPLSSPTGIRAGDVNAETRGRRMCARARAAGSNSQRKWRIICC